MTGNNIEGINHLEEILDQTFKIKDLGILYFFFGIKIEYYDSAAFIHQTKYVKELIEEFGCSQAQSCITPIHTEQKLQANVGVTLQDIEKYRSLVGKHNYLTNIRPGIAFTVQQLSQFLQAPRIPHY